jgi:hypothetical protein
VRYHLHPIFFFTLSFYGRSATKLFSCRGASPKNLGRFSRTYVQLNFEKIVWEDGKLLLYKGDYPAVKRPFDILTDFSAKFPEGSIPRKDRMAALNWHSCDNAVMNMTDAVQLLFTG